MEEKERFELFGEHCIKDNNPDARCQLLDAYVACVILNEQDKENQQLKQQIAEKNKEIESLRENSLSKRIFKEKLIPSHCMEQYEKYEQQIDKLTQDKILFAVEQLTQAIKNIKKCNYKDFGIMYQSDAIAVIDNQINELKGKVEDVKD